MIFIWRVLRSRAGIRLVRKRNRLPIAMAKAAELMRVGHKKTPRPDKDAAFV